MPKQSPDIYGRVWTNRYRLRPTLFGVVLERLVEYPSGASLWKRSEWPLDLGEVG